LRPPLVIERRTLPFEDGHVIEGEQALCAVYLEIFEPNPANAWCAFVGAAAGMDIGEDTSCLKKYAELLYVP
jgi:hypothetical protein